MSDRDPIPSVATSPRISLVDVFTSFVANLPKGHTLTGFTFEVSHPLSADHTVRANGGTYQELLDTFDGDASAFVAELLKGYSEASAEGDRKFLETLSQEAGK